MEAAIRLGIDPCVVVGASVAGLRAAEGLRKGGYSGPIIIFGAEKHMPYNRPPLSKSGVSAAGGLEPEYFRILPALEGVEWCLDDPVVSADLTARTITSQSGRVQPWAGLVAATGLRPRTLNLPGPRRGRHVLRSVDDAALLRSDLEPGSRVVVVGAGFVGCEVAMTMAALGLETHIVDPLALPMERQLGPLLAQVVSDRLEAAGIAMHFDSLPMSYVGEESITGVHLEDGNVIAAEVVVEAVGSVPNVEWLSGNGLDLTDGVLCDGELRVDDRGDVLACGDIARFAHPLRGAPGRIEHWMMAGDTGRRAGRNLALHMSGAQPSDVFAPVPSFWSDLGATRLQSFGMPGEGMGDVCVLEGDLSGEVAVGYHRSGELIGVVLVGLASRHQHYRAQVAASCAAVVGT